MPLIASRCVHDDVAAAAVAVGTDLVVEIGEILAFQVFEQLESTFLRAALMAIWVDVDDGLIALAAREVECAFALEVLY